MAVSTPINYLSLTPKKATLAEHQNAENTEIGASTAGSQTAQYDQPINGATQLSQAITTTKRCCIVVVAVSGQDANSQKTQIRRGGVDKTLETTITAVNWFMVGGYAHLQYATEVLNAGTYTYDLVNTSGGVIQIYGSVMKIVAVSAT